MSLRGRLVSGLQFFKKPKAVVLLVAIVSIWVASNVNWGATRNRNGIVVWDAKGYYAYLPALFIYDDFDFVFYDTVYRKKYKAVDSTFEFRNQLNDDVINKYFAGVAVLQMPFFFASHVCSIIFSQAPDGYSALYTIGVNLAAIFYLILGLLLLNSAMKELLINEGTRSVTLLFTAFGTNVFYYTVEEPGMSHIYSFALSCAFILIAFNYFRQPNAQRVYGLAAILALSILIRPINVLFILSLPFLAGDKSLFLKGLVSFISSFKTVLISILIIVIICSVQLLYYKMQSGSFLVYSYSNEGFDFSRLRLFDFMFSYKKGLFIYMPILLLIVPSITYLIYKRQFLSISFMIFFFIVVYVQSSWWQWWYGGSFGSRVMIEYIPFIVVPISVFLSKINLLFIKRFFRILIIFLIVFCQIQTYQYRHKIIHWDSMNKRGYWYGFMKISLDKDERHHLNELLNSNETQ